MACAMLQIQKKGEIIRAQAEDIRQDLGSSGVPNLHALVLTGVAMGKSWRSLAVHIAETREFRELSASSAEAVAISLEVYDRIITELDKPGGECVPTVDVADLRIAQHEVENIARWIATWPTYDAGHRSVARDEIARGLTLSVDQFIATLA